ncbi:MAG: hypothetical protein RSD00_02035, partial [Bacilli bacterium]
MKVKERIIYLSITVCLLVISITSISYGLIKKDKPKEDILDKKSFITNGYIPANLAMLSKPLGTTTFTEITSTPTTGSWTIESDCRGMSVIWDDTAHKLKVSVTQAPASCKLKFIEKEVPKKYLREFILADNVVKNVENDSMFAHIA